MPGATHSPSQQPERRVEMRRDGHFAKWQPAQEPLDPNTVHKLTFAVKIAGEPVTKELMAVSDPDSPRYGQHLDFEEAGKLFSNPAATDAVVQFLTENGCSIVKKTPHGQFIHAEAPISTWNRILDADFQRFTHSSSFAQTATLGTARATTTTTTTLRVPDLIRTPHLTIPEVLADSVHLVDRGTSLPSPSLLQKSMQNLGSSVSMSKDHRHARRKLSQADDGGYVQLTNITSIRSWYQTENVVGSSLSTGAVAEFGNYYADLDVLAFQDYWGLPVVSIDNALNNPKNLYQQSCLTEGCAEALLDVQYLSGVSTSSPVAAYSYDLDGMVQLASDLVELEHPPYVLSISYGGPEVELNSASMEMFCDTAKYLGLRGVSIFVSSGDNGANACPRFAGGTLQDCDFAPHFPASCPYVITVGATMRTSASASGGQEAQNTCHQKVNDTYGAQITSGGGFSDFFEMPDFQANTVKNYLNNEALVLPPASYYNPTGRAYPDLAATGHNYFIVYNATLNPDGTFNDRSLDSVDGTSASTPLVAALAMLVNARRLEAGLGPMGFILPALYKTGAGTAMTTDVTEGGNRCCGNFEAPQPIKKCPWGYNATQGWDPVTGFGIPDYPRFLAAFGPDSSYHPGTTTSSGGSGIPTTTRQGFPIPGVTEDGWVVTSSVLMVIVLALIVGIVVLVLRMKAGTRKNGLDVSDPQLGVPLTSSRRAVTAATTAHRSSAEDKTDEL